MRLPWDSGEPTNADRADWAENAANTFSDETYGGQRFTELLIEQPDKGDDAYTVIQDLITDLLHLTRRSGWDPHEMADDAIIMFDAEEHDETTEAT